MNVRLKIRKNHHSKEQFNLSVFSTIPILYILYNRPVLIIWIIIMLLVLIQDKRQTNGQTLYGDW